ncbi:MAG: GNAT family N-acetyltransferase [Asgard group archaeon]|nr:GNAT family N-acetyltransferase [Asgard group archaeon]
MFFSKAVRKDLTNIYNVLETTGWGETYDDVLRAFNNPKCDYLFVYGEQSEQTFGIVLIVNYGKVGFIGHLVVHPEYRNLGIGQELLQQAIDTLLFAGCKTIKLDAVKKALTLYNRLGFEKETTSLRFTYLLNTKKNLSQLEKLLLEQKKEFHIYPIKENNLHEIIKKDIQLFGADRKEILLSYLTDFPEYCFAIKNQLSNLVGYVFGKYQNGSLYLKAGFGKTKIIIQLLITKSYLQAMKNEDFKAINIGILEDCQKGVEILRKLPFKQKQSSIRMYYGESSNATIHKNLFAIGDPAKG